MPKITLKRRSVWIPEASELRDLVWVCTTVEKPDDDVSTIVRRPGVIKVHARIRQLRPDQIMDYQAVFGTQDPPPTVEITIRMPPDVKVDLNHWVYRITGHAQIWYKVRNTEDLGGVGRYLIMNCNIDTVNDVRNDPATQEPPPFWEVPERA